MKRNILAFVLVSVLAVSCDWYYDGFDEYRYYDNTTQFLTLRNYSSEATVWFIPSKENSENLPSELSEWQKISIYDVDSRSSMSLDFDSDDNYVTPVETYSPTDRMVIYVFLKSVWDSHTWAELVNGQLWSAKVSYSVEEIVAQNKTVTYPIQ